VADVGVRLFFIFDKDSCVLDCCTVLSGNVFLQVTRQYRATIQTAIPVEK